MRGYSVLARNVYTAYIRTNITPIPTTVILTNEKEHTSCDLLFNYFSLADTLALRPLQLLENGRFVIDPKVYGFYRAIDIKVDRPP